MALLLQRGMGGYFTRGRLQKTGSNSRGREGLSQGRFFSCFWRVKGVARGVYSHNCAMLGVRAPSTVNGGEEGNGCAQSLTTSHTVESEDREQNGKRHTSFPCIDADSLFEGVYTKVFLFVGGLLLRASLMPRRRPTRRWLTRRRPPGKALCQSAIRFTQ